MTKYTVVIEHIPTGRMWSSDPLDSSLATAFLNSMKGDMTGIPFKFTKDGNTHYIMSGVLTDCIVTLEK